MAVVEARIALPCLFSIDCLRWCTPCPRETGGGMWSAGATPCDRIACGSAWGCGDTLQTTPRDATITGQVEGVPDVSRPAPGRSDMSLYLTLDFITDFAGLRRASVSV